MWLPYSNEEYGVAAIGTDEVHEKTKLFDGIDNRWFDHLTFCKRHPDNAPGKD